MPTAFAQALSSSTATATSALTAIASGTARAGQAAFSFYLSNLDVLEVISIIVTTVLVVAVVYIALETGWWRTRRDRYHVIILKTNLSKKRAAEGWAIAQKHFFAGDDNDLKIAVMQADTILEEALLHAGVRGTNLGDRLKNLKRGQVPNLEDLWAAHKLRNQIAHEPVFKLKRDTAERALEAYQTALKNLGVLE